MSAHSTDTKKDIENTSLHNESNIHLPESNPDQELSQRDFQKYISGTMATLEYNLNYLLDQIVKENREKKSSLDTGARTTLHENIIKIENKLEEYYEIYNFINKIQADLDDVKNNFTILQGTDKKITELEIIVGELTNNRNELQQRINILENKAEIANQRLNTLTSTTLLLRAIYRRLKLRLGFTQSS